MDSRTLAYQRFYAATQPIRDHPAKPLEATAPRAPVCGVCARPWDAVEEPGKALAYRYESGMAYQWQCMTCATGRLGSSGAFGVERYSKGHPVAAKLNMMSGTPVIITADNVMHIAPPKKIADKIAHGIYAQRGQVHSRTGKFPLLLLLTRLWKSGELGDVERGFVCIGGFNRKLGAVMSNLRVSTSLHEVWIIDDSGRRTIDVLGLLALRDRLRDLGLERKACQAKFWRPIFNATQGQYDDAAIDQWMEQTPGGDNLVSLLPTDPHVRLEVPKYLNQMEDA